MPARVYQERVAVLPRVLAAADAPGEEVESWPDPVPAQEHWAVIENPTGFEASDTPKQSNNAMQLRFRHQIPLAATDRVRLKDSGDVWCVVGVWRERCTDAPGWQTVCTLASPLYG